jgi:hypothetical protein
VRTRLRERLDEPHSPLRRGESRTATVRLQRLLVRQDAAAEDDRHGVLAGIAGSERGRAVFVVRVRRVVCVSRQSVLVLGMIVIGGDVRVPCGRLASRGRDGHADQDGDQAAHSPSLWKPSRQVKKRPWLHQLGGCRYHRA